MGAATRQAAGVVLVEQDLKRKAHQGPPRKGASRDRMWRSQAAAGRRSLGLGRPCGLLADLAPSPSGPQDEASAIRARNQSRHAMRSTRPNRCRGSCGEGVRLVPSRAKLRVAYQQLLQNATVRGFILSGAPSSWLDFERCSAAQLWDA